LLLHRHYEPQFRPPPQYVLRNARCFHPAHFRDPETTRAIRDSVERSGEALFGVTHSQGRDAASERGWAWLLILERFHHLAPAEQEGVRHQP
jgi:hypothetical protein